VAESYFSEVSATFTIGQISKYHARTEKATTMMISPDEIEKVAEAIRLKKSMTIEEAREVAKAALNAARDLGWKKKKKKGKKGFGEG
jgi:hypothetical protein